MISPIFPSWPPRVQQLLELFDPEWDRLARAPSVQPMPGIGTCYLYSVKAVPRSLIPLLTRFKENRSLLYLVHFEFDGHGREVWIGTLCGVGVEIRLQHPACVCNKLTSSGRLTLTVSSEVLALERFLADRAQCAREWWVQRGCEPLYKAGTPLGLTTIARGLIHSLPRQSQSRIRVLCQFWWAVTRVTLAEIGWRMREQPRGNSR